MGPPSLNGGNPQRVVRHGVLVHRASMGPPSLNGGNEGMPQVEATERRRLQWGRRLSTAEISGLLRSLRTAMALQWGRRLSTAEILRPIAGSRPTWRFNGAAVSQRRKSGRRPRWDASFPQRFNGAAVSQRRKCARGAAASEARREASMGPPSLNGGNAVFQCHRRRAFKLQGGRRLSTAEIVGIRVGIVPNVQLQWGRRLSTAEMITQDVEQIAHVLASMGPPSLNGGNYQIYTAPGVPLTLQWGRRLSTAEIARTETPCRTGTLSAECECPPSTHNANLRR
jgi:hypothetical protein